MNSSFREFLQSETLLKRKKKFMKVSNIEKPVAMNNAVDLKFWKIILNPKRERVAGSKLEVMKVIWAPKNV